MPDICAKVKYAFDYGCGKGRVDFFLSYQTRCASIGIEYDERIYEKAAENHTSAVSSGRVTFELANVEYYQVPESVDCVYFFNPFSVEIPESHCTDPEVIVMHVQDPCSYFSLSIR